MQVKTNGMGSSQYSVVNDIHDLKEAIYQLKPLSDLHVGELLIGDGVITQEQLQEALQKKGDDPSKRVGRILVELGYANQTQISLALARKFGIPYVQLKEFEISPDVLSIIPADMALQYNVLPLAIVEGMLVVAMEDPMDWEARDIIQFHANRNIEVVIASSSDISQTLSEYYSHHEDADILEDFELNPIEQKPKHDAQAEVTEHMASQKPVVRLLNALLQQAVIRGASDINIRPEKTRVNVFFRVDGKLQFIRSLSRSMLPSLVSRVKVIGQMDVAEHFLPQDGHAKIRRADHEIDLRLSVIPTVSGESVVIRILDTDVGLKPLTQIGFDERELQILRDLTYRSFGMFLVTGPTGSGKSTTLYALLNEMKRRGPHIITVEDPVEYHMKGVEQIQVSAIRGYTFAEALKHILRHDPDVVMIGEIRDIETARIANKAALTGHIVLSTLHTNDAASAVTRLIDMGVEPYLLSTTLLGTMAQRLIRLNCSECVREEAPDPELCKQLGVREDEVFYRGAGCPSCNHTGYHGRIAVCELLPMTPMMRRLIVEGADSQTIKQAAMKEGMMTLTQHALAMAREGKTSLEEVYSIRLD
jgi:type IV pilus assembly protein PilB